MDKIRSSSTYSSQVSIQAQQKSDLAEASKSTHSSLRQLPNEVQSAILSFLDQKSALSFGATCKYYDEITRNDRHIWVPSSANTLRHPSEVGFSLPKSFRSMKQSKEPTWREVWLIGDFLHRTSSKINKVMQMTAEYKQVESADSLVSLMKSLNNKDVSFFPLIADSLLRLSVKVTSNLECVFEVKRAAQLMLEATAFLSKPEHVLSQEIWVEMMNNRLSDAKQQAYFNSKSINHAVENAEFFALKSGKPIPQIELVAIANICLREFSNRINTLQETEKSLNTLESFFRISSKIKEPVSNTKRQQIASQFIGKAKRQVSDLDKQSCAKDAMTSVVIAYLLQPSSQITFDAHLNDVKNAFSAAQTRALHSYAYTCDIYYDYEFNSIKEEIVKLTADGIKQSLQEICASNPIVASLARLLGHFDPLPS